MPFYSGLNRYTLATRSPIAKKLVELRKHLSENIPTRTVNQSLLLATWNIRDFDSNKFGHGPRLIESFFYIAEIISRFDLIAIQEVTRDLRALKKVLEILGPHWSYMVTDVTEGSSGNNERMAFVYDTNKVRFANMAGEVVLPQKKLINLKDQFARSPYVVAFQSGWFKFQLCTVHIYYGAGSGTKLKRRIKEIEKLAQFFSARSKKEAYNYIMLGDFNIVSPKHQTMDALLDNGFVVPDELRHPTNIDRTKYYDQIAFRMVEGEVLLGTSNPNAGVYNMFDVVFRDDEYDKYHDVMKPRLRDFKGDKPRTEEEKEEYYRGKWRTFQMSDHLPMWVELQIDFSDEYLKKVAEKTSV